LLRLNDKIDLGLGRPKTPFLGQILRPIFGRVPHRCG
jgi:hypothetical protein